MEGHVFPGGTYPLPEPTSPLLPDGPQEGPSLPSHLVSTRHVCSFSVATPRGSKTWEVGSLTVLTRSTNKDVHGAVLLFWELWGRTLGLQSCHSRLCLSSHCPPLHVSRSAPVPIRTCRLSILNLITSAKILFPNKVTQVLCLGLRLYWGAPGSLPQHVLCIHTTPPSHSTP